jgi:hypothetical protein
MILLRSFKQPTKVYIIGNSFQSEEIKPAFSITDDYHSCAVKSSKNRRYMETDGFVYILTEEEFQQYKDTLYEDSYQDAIVLENFEGDIYVSLVDSEGNNVLEDKVDIDDYLCYQCKDGADIEDILVVLPDGYEIPKTVSVESLL